MKTIELLHLHTFPNFSLMILYTIFLSKRNKRKKEKKTQPDDFKTKKNCNFPETEYVLICTKLENETCIF